MNKFFYYYNPACSGINMPTVFANDPYVVVIKDILFNELCHLVYYIQKLKQLNVDMNLYTDKVIEFIYILIVNLDFKKESFGVILDDLNENKIKLKNLYQTEALKQNVSAEFLDEDSDNESSKDIILNSVNNKINAYVNNETVQDKSQNKKSIAELINNLVLNSCSTLIELRNYDVNPVDIKSEVLTLINTLNYSETSEDELISIINNFSKVHYRLTKLFYSSVQNRYGKVTKGIVWQKTVKGKSILVSGTSFFVLEKVLQALNGTDINVYTHNGMINAFSLPYFNKYSNLIGHYQYEGSNYQKDFATFPGPVYISDNLIPKIDIIRGHIYTSVKYPAFGISKIENDDFSELVECAKKSIGFDINSDNEEIPVGFDVTDTVEHISYITSLVTSEKIERIIIIGQSDTFNKRNDYITDFLYSVEKDDYVIHFSFNPEKNNMWRVNNAFNFVLLYKIIEELKAKLCNIEDILSIFFTDCNSNTISHILNIRQLGVKRIFLGQCCPNVINPVLLNGMYKLFNVKQLTDPKKDLSLLKNTP